MFAKANAIAQHYTFPLIVPFRKPDGSCSAGVGTFNIINDEGWFITALHVIERIEEMQGKLEKGSITHWYAMFGIHGVVLDPSSLYTLPEVDLAVGKLLHFSKDMVTHYPKFRPSKDLMYPGTSLCKLGYAFNHLKPTFSQHNGFKIPSIPKFPIDGIFTRIIFILSEGKYPFPLIKIETSTPALAGQSGGAIFDKNGVLCGMVTETVSYDIGFGTDRKFLVGMGVHCDTITGFLKELGIKFSYAKNQTYEDTKDEVE